MLGEAHRRLGAARSGRRGGGDARPGQDRRTARRHPRSPAALYRLPRQPLPELDVPAVWPAAQVVLVDELAHTNTPGSRTQTLDGRRRAARRRHRGDLHGQRATSGRASTTSSPRSPASSSGDGARRIVRRAPQIELVDITPEHLRRRLSHGKCTPREGRCALSNYFRAATSPHCAELALLSPTRSTPPGESTGPTTRSTPPGRPSANVSSRSPAAPNRRPWCAALLHCVQKSSAELMIVHVVRRRLSGFRAPQMGSRDAGQPPASAPPCTPSWGDSAEEFPKRSGLRPPDERHPIGHRHIAPAPLLGRDVRRGHRRSVGPGSGKIDVHMVTRGTIQGARIGAGRVAPTVRHRLSWVGRGGRPRRSSARHPVCSTVPQDPRRDRSHLLHRCALVALLGGSHRPRCPVLSGLLLNYFLTEPATYVHHRRTRLSAITGKSCCW